MIRMIVARCHVADTNREVVAYVVSCLRPGAWESLPKSDRFRLMRESLRCHRENRALYAFVQRGF
jgi:hypothetical protein